MQPKLDIKKIIDLRQKLHKFAELSGKEEQTRQILLQFFERFKPTKIHHFSDTSIAFEFGDVNKPAIIFRAEMDALPIDETLDLPYASINTGVSHKCGHDGHMAILTGLAEAISKFKNLTDRVIFLFQSAEETLSGALNILSDEAFKQLNPGIFIGFHNIPGYSYNSILIKEADFSSFVTGLKITLKGNSWHAADSQTNTIPMAIMRLLQFFAQEFPLLPVSKKGAVNITHIQYGEPGFGISPNKAIIHLTLRAYSNDDLDEIIDAVEEQIKLTAYTSKLQWNFKYTEDAPSIYNSADLVKIAREATLQLGLKLINLDKPFSWGEDFGYYTIKHKSLYFGIGAGVETPPLHSELYDFPDEIILPSIEYLFNLYLSLKSNL